MAMCVPCVWLVYGDVCGVYQGWRLFRGKVVVGRGHALVGCRLVWVFVIAAVGAWFNNKNKNLSYRHYQFQVIE